MDNVFELIQGVRIDDVNGVHNAYKIEDEVLTAVVSADKIKPLVNSVIKTLEAPVFFFVEVPCTDEEENKIGDKDNLHYNVYYFDGCTTEVALAIMKRYGDILVNDGLSRFGFGSHETGREIYCQNYQTIMIYGDRLEEVNGKLMEKLCIPKDEDILTIWDKINNENVGESCMTEIDGETVFNIVENLTAEGMYLADTVAEN